MEFQKVLSSFHWKKNRNDQEQNKSAEKELRKMENQRKNEKKKDEMKDKENNPSCDKK